LLALPFLFLWTSFFTLPVPCALLIPFSQQLLPHPQPFLCQSYPCNLPRPPSDRAFLLSSRRAKRHSSTFFFFLTPFLYSLRLTNRFSLFFFPTPWDSLLSFSGFLPQGRSQRTGDGTLFFLPFPPFLPILFRPPVIGSLEVVAFLFLPLFVSLSPRFVVL